jgi:hypothetical protein
MLGCILATASWAVWVSMLLRPRCCCCARRRMAIDPRRARAHAMALNTTICSFLLNIAPSFLLLLLVWLLMACIGCFICAADLALEFLLKSCAPPVLEKLQLLQVSGHISHSSLSTDTVSLSPRRKMGSA